MLRSAADDEVLVVVSVDTEEDSWTPSRHVTVENIRRIPAFHSFVRSLGVRPTYFVTHPVAGVEWAAEILAQAVDDGRGEVCAHLHAWNTPPFEEELIGYNTVMRNLPPDLQRKKLERLTERHEQAFGRRPASFRAGRFGLGPAAVPHLIDLGYRVDSSVTPFWSWESYDHGPDFQGAPNHPYYLSSNTRDVTVPDPGGELIEVPVSGGFTRRPFRFWNAVQRTLTAPPLDNLHLAGVAARLGLFQKVILTPEVESVDAMIGLSKQLLRQGAGYLHLFLHSSSLQPGLSPFAAYASDVRRIERRIASFVERVEELAPVRFVTVETVARAWQAPVGSGAGSLEE